MFLILYFIVTLIILYTEALDCYRCKAKMDVRYSVVFSLLWIVSVPFSIWSIWKELK